MNVELVLALIFYGVVILLIYLNRQKFDIQAKVIALYRMKVGLRSMDTIADRYPRLVHWFAVSGIYIGFLGMLAIIGMLVFGAYQVFFIPGAPPAVAPVLPGIPIPGSPITIPLVSGILCIFLVAAIHEFSHGVVARRYKYVVKNTGIVFFGPIVGAFVEPDEEALKKAPLSHRLGIFAAGSYSNILLGIGGILLLLFVLFPIGTNFVQTEGVTLLSVQADYPAESAGMLAGQKVTAINGEQISSRLDFSKRMSTIEVGESIEITADATTFTVVPTTNPAVDGAYIGVTIQDAIGTKSTYKPYQFFVDAFFWVVRFVQLLVIISIGIGLFNLVPIGPIDGGRMSLALLQHMNPKKAQKIWFNISAFLLFVLALNFIPFLKAVFQSIF